MAFGCVTVWGCGYVCLGVCVYVVYRRDVAQVRFPAHPRVHSCSLSPCVSFAGQFPTFPPRQHSHTTHIYSVGHRRPMELGCRGHHPRPEPPPHVKHHHPHPPCDQAHAQDGLRRHVDAATLFPNSFFLSACIQMACLCITDG